MISKSRWSRRLLPALALSLGACGGSPDDVASTSQAQTQGLELLKDIRQTVGATTEGSEPHGFVKLGQKIYFLGRIPKDGERVEALFGTDGTAAGTELVRELGDQQHGVGPRLAVHAGKLYAFAINSAGDLVLVESDGTRAGTRDLLTLAPAAGRPRAGDIASTTSGLLATIHARDPSSASSSRVTTLAKISGSQADVIYTGDSSSGFALTLDRVIQGGTHTLLLEENSGGESASRALITDGTAAGTRLVSEPFEVMQAAPLGHDRFVVASPRVTGLGSRLYVLDAKSLTTTGLPTLESPSAQNPLFVSGIVAMGQNVVLIGESSISGRQRTIEIWSSDGTEQGTTLVWSGTQAGAEIGFHLADAGGALYVAFHGGPLVRTVDGTQATTTTVPGFPSQAIMDSGKRLKTLVSDGTRLIASFGKSFTPRERAIAVFDPATGQSTETMPTDIAPSDDDNEWIGTPSGAIFSCATSARAIEPCISDGTAQGTRILRTLDEGGSLSSYPHDFHIVGDVAYFVANDGAHGEELWVTDGTDQGTHLVKDLTTGAGSTRFVERSDEPTPLQAEGALAVGSTFFFMSDDRTTKTRTLWRTDGTDQGTFAVAEIYGSEHRYVDKLPDPVVAGGALYYVKEGPNRRCELRRNDGTAQGDVSVAELAPALSDPLPSRRVRFGLVSLGTHALAVDFADIGQDRAWLTDGSAQGTRVVAFPGNPIATSNGVGYFASAAYGGSPKLVRKLDAATATLTPLDLAKAGAGLLSECAAVVNGDLVYYAAGEGGDVWRTNATSQGTEKLASFGGERRCWFGGLTRTHRFRTFTALSRGSGPILISDGTSTGTVEVTTTSASARVHAAPDDKGIIVADGRSLLAWTAPGAPVRTLATDLELTPADVTSVPGALLVRTELWTEGPSHLIHVDWTTGQSRPVSMGAAFRPGRPSVIGARVVLPAESAQGDRELYRAAISTL